MSSNHESNTPRSDTPRTDAVEVYEHEAPACTYLVTAEFARTLERELAQVLTQIENQASIIRDSCTPANVREQRMLEELAQLRAWKESALAVEAGWSVQRVAKLLGLKLGTDIRPQIEPAIAELLQDKARVELVQQAVQDLRASKLSQGAFCIAVSALVMPQPEPTPEDIAWAQKLAKP